MYRIYLDNQILTDEPDGWTAFTTKINRNFDDRWLLVTYPVDLVFYGDGFNFLYEKFNDKGYDVLVDFLAQQLDDAGNEISSTFGSIIMTDVTFDLVRKTATTQIKENSYMSRIFGNRNNPITLPTSETKNGEVIDNFDTARRYYQMSFDDVVSATPVTNARREGIFVYDALKSMVSNMTDNEVTFESDILANLGTSDLYPRNLMLLSGKELRLGQTASAPGDALIKISFADLFRDVSRLLNLYLYPDTSEIPPKIVAGSEYDWYSSKLSVDFDQPDELEMSFFQELFYNKVRLGGQTSFSSTDPALNYPNLPFASFKNEEYYFSGVNNIDNELQLTTTSVIIDSNIFNDVLVNGTEAFDDSIFMVEVGARDGLVYPVQGYSIANTTVMNRRMMTDQVLLRYNMANRVTQNIGAINTDYRFALESSDAELTQQGTCEKTYPANTTITQPDLTKNCYDQDLLTMTQITPFGTNTTAGAGVWDGQKFTAPSTGVWGFEFNYTFTSNGDGLLATWHTKASLTAVRKSGTTIIEQIPIGEVNLTDDGTVNAQSGSIAPSLQISMNTNETMEIVSTINSHIVGNQTTPNLYPSNPPTIRLTYAVTEATIEMTQQPVISIDFPQPDITPEQYRGSKIMIETALNQEEIKTLYRRPNYSLQINNFVNQDELKRAWIYSAEINETTGKCSFELITNLTKFDESTLSQRRSGGGIDAPSCQVEILCFANPLNSQYIPLI